MRVLNIVSGGREAEQKLRLISEGAVGSKVYSSRTDATLHVQDLLIRSSPTSALTSSIVATTMMCCVPPKWGRPSPTS